MDIETYKTRADSRLAAIDALDKLCQWEKFLAEITDPAERLTVASRRKRRERLMREQMDDEVAAGL